MKVHYKLETFEGPLDLLLHLIDKAEIDIYDIPISEITDQYMAYLETMQELELEVTSEFLVMAATLLAIKSQMLLPKPPPAETDIEYANEAADEDPRAELVQKLIEYRKYKMIAEELRDKELARSLIYTREPADLSPYIPDVDANPVLGLHVSDLAVAFLRALRKAERRNAVAKIRRDEISVRDRMIDVLERLERRGGKLMFSQLIGDDDTRQEIVATFLALLELMKVQKIVCFQHRLFGDIVIEAREDGKSFELPSDQIDY